MVNDLYKWRHFGAILMKPKLLIKQKILYIIKDVSIGLGLLYSLVKHFGVATDTFYSLINFACTMMERDYFKEAKIIESLGFDTIEKLLKKIEKITTSDSESVIVIRVTGDLIP